MGSARIAVERLRTRLDDRRFGHLLPALGLSVAAAVIVFLVSTELFPYYSSNHDEAVYLQQAAMLLEGQLAMYPGEIAESVRPWFFVLDGNRMYPKYSAVSAAVFALGKLVAGEFRVSLALVAGLNALFTHRLTAEAFDERTAHLAAIALLGSPLFLFSSSVFLPYAPTLLFELLFALAYVRAARGGGQWYAALAGIAIGIAFFSRPYTAVLFALPFAGHVLFSLGQSIRGGDRDALFRQGRRYATLSAFGLAFVGVTLAYNRAMTGSALTFPYEAFAPNDGLGFGRREILGYSRVYDPELALRANARVLWSFATEWIVAGPIGTALAAVGVGGFLTRVRSQSARIDDPSALSDVELRAIFVGLIVSVSVGNVFFWGNLNVLGGLENPNDGLVALLGPFYHFDLLVPLSAFVASGALFSVRTLRSMVGEQLSARHARFVLVVALLVAAPVVAAAERDVVEPTVEANAAVTQQYAESYVPFEHRSFSNALVFVPTPYGDWMNHPFQSLRNDPGLDGDTVYALDRKPAADFAVLDTYENRTAYRYTYRVTNTRAREWRVNADQRVHPTIQRLDLRRGSSVDGTTTVGIPESARSVSVRLATGRGATQFVVNDSRVGNGVPIAWSISPDTVRLRGSNVEPVGGGNATIPRSGTGSITLSVTVVQPGGATLTYRQELAADAENGTVRVIWPPELFVCTLVDDCGHRGTYLPNQTTYPDDVWITATANGTEAAATRTVPPDRRSR